jgi:hypothetical protein
VSQGLCESRVIVEIVYGELVGCKFADLGVRPVAIVVRPMLLRHDLCFEQGWEDLDGQEFVA